MAQVACRDEARLSRENKMKYREDMVIWEIKLFFVYWESSISFDFNGCLTLWGPKWSEKVQQSHYLELKPLIMLLSFSFVKNIPGVLGVD